MQETFWLPWARASCLVRERFPREERKTTHLRDGEHASQIAGFDELMKGDFAGAMEKRKDVWKDSFPCSSWEGHGPYASVQAASSEEGRTALRQKAARGAPSEPVLWTKPCVSEADVAVKRAKQQARGRCFAALGFRKICAAQEVAGLSAGYDSIGPGDGAHARKPSTCWRHAHRPSLGGDLLRSVRRGAWKMLEQAVLDEGHLHFQVVLLHNLLSLHAGAAGTSFSDYEQPASQRAVCQEKESEPQIQGRLLFVLQKSGWEPQSHGSVFQRVC